MYNRKIALFMIFLGVSGIAIQSMENDITKISDLSYNIVHQGDKVSSYPFMAAQRMFFRNKLAVLINATKGILTGEYSSNANNLNYILQQLSDCKNILQVFVVAPPLPDVPYYASQSIHELLAELEKLRTLIEARKSNQ
jgi:hypothetical protein